MYPVTPNDYKYFLNRNIDSLIENGGFIQLVNENTVFDEKLSNISGLFEKIESKETAKKAEVSFIYNLLHSGNLYKNNFSNFLDTNKMYIEEILIKRGLNDVKLNFSEYQDLTSKMNWYKLTFKRYNIIDFEDNMFIPTNIMFLKGLYKTFNTYGDNIKNFGKQDLFEKYILQEIVSESDLMTSISFLRENNIKKIDIVDRTRKTLIEVKFSDFYKTSWDEYLIDKEFLKKYDLNGFKKIGVYLGDTFETKFGVTWMNIYDFMKHINREHLLEKVEEDKLVINTNNDILSWD